MKKLTPIKFISAVVAIAAALIMGNLILIKFKPIWPQASFIPRIYKLDSSRSGESVETTTKTATSSSLLIQRIVTNQFMGRLGNLMFEVASSYGIARHNNMQYQLQCGSNEANQISLAFKQISKLPCIHQFTDFAKRHLPWGTYQLWTLELRNNNESMEFSGYMQSFKYFWPFRDEIRRLFQFDSVTKATALSVLKNVTKLSPGSVVIGVHVRRGDYLSTESVDFGYNLPDQDYFNRTLAFFRAKYPRVVFLVVSEDLTWCRMNMEGTDLVFFTSGDALGDMCLVSHADHVIISVGTYGWWSGFLCQGQVLYYRDIARNGSGYSKDYVAEDFFPKEWIPF